MSLVFGGLYLLQTVAKIIDPLSEKSTIKAHDDNNRKRIGEEISAALTLLHLTASSSLEVTNMPATIPLGQADREKIDRELDQIRKQMRVDESEFSDVQAKEQAEYRRKMKEKAQHFLRLFEEYLGVYDLLLAANKAWRSRVFRGEEPFDLKVDSTLRNLFAVWNTLSDPMRQRAEYHVRHNLCDDKLTPLVGKLVVNSDNARRVYLTWESPALSSSPALRTVKVPKDQITKARELFAK
jgi:hypothetical protein